MVHEFVYRRCFGGEESVVVVVMMIVVVVGAAAAAAAAVAVDVYKKANAKSNNHAVNWKSDRCSKTSVFVVKVENDGYDSGDGIIARDHRGRVVGLGRLGQARQAQVLGPSCTVASGKRRSRLTVTPE